MKNAILAPVLVCSITTSLVAEADKPALTTSFTFEVVIGDRSFTYDNDLTKAVDVVMPSNGWECQRSRVNVADSRYMGGFMCSNDNWTTSVGTKAACSFVKTDIDKTSFMVTKAYTNSPVMLISTCVTTSKSLSPSSGVHL